MSQIDHTQPDRNRLGADKIILGLLAVLIIGALFFVSSQRQQQLRSSPSGLDGLQVWLASEGQAARNFVGGWSLNADEIGLLILPLYDTDLKNSRVPPKSEEKYILQQDEYDLSIEPILSKAAEVPVLLVLPKWRSGMRLTGLAHPFLLAEQAKITDTLNDLIDTSDARLTSGQQPFLEFSYKAHTATVYAAQMFTASGCTPVIGTARAMILGSCQLPGGEPVYVLSDPDLINNHGLALGDNAFAIRDFAAEIAGDQQIVIDYSRGNWLTRDTREIQRDRTWSDLMRFFAPPFTLMWVGLAITVVLVLWRAAMRFGPLIKAPDVIGAGKMMAIGARARLMRLSNRDGALVADYGKARLAATAANLVGSANASQISNQQAFLTYTQRRHPKHAAALVEALNAINALPQGASTGLAMAAVADLDTILEQITHDT
ncbi:MAG: hypothetical protein ABJ251_01640 [Paracoccaceae bacterium]